jgi:signal peptide peptidase SppA
LFLCFVSKRLPKIVLLIIMKASVWRNLVAASALLLFALPNNNKFYPLVRGGAAASIFDDSDYDDESSSDEDDDGILVHQPPGAPQAPEGDNDVHKKKASSGSWRNDEKDDDDDDSDDDGIYQRNPDYVKPPPPVSIDAVLLAQNNNQTGTVRRSIRRVAKIAKTLVKSKGAIASVIGIYLLVRLVSFPSIKLFLVGAFVTVRRDPKTGQVVAVQLHVQRLLQLAVFLGIVYQTIRTRHDVDNNSDGAAEEEEKSSTTSLLTTMLLGPGYGTAANLLRRWLRPPGQRPPNPAFVPPVQQHYTFENLNDRYGKDVLALTKASKNTLPLTSATTTISSNKNNTAATAVQKNNSTVVVLDWTGLDSSVSNLDTLKDSVSFLLSLPSSDTNINEDNSSNKKNFDVVVVLESPGGAVAPYAMAAQQLCRLRRASHHVTVCVDAVAASGGYMIACCANAIVAAPFALVGSIGVVGQSVNVHKVLENWGVRPLVFRGGRDKAPLGLIGEVTDENISKVQGMVDDTHRAFKRHVVDNRPVLATNIETIATGDVWFGYDALQNGLIDAIGTSDEYLMERMKQGARVLKLQQVIRKGPFGGLTTVEADLGGVPSVRPDDRRRRAATVLAKAVLGAESWRHVTSWLGKIDSMLLQPLKTTTATAQFP